MRNFADFKTGQGSMRAAAMNLKRVFIRDRRPKRRALRRSFHPMSFTTGTTLPASEVCSPAIAYAAAPAIRKTRPRSIMPARSRTAAA